jgi:cell division protein FtsZ
MKDDVKITVIATGFKGEQPHRRERAMAAAAPTISSARPIPSYQPAVPLIAQQPSSAAVMQASNGYSNGHSAVEEPEPEPVAVSFSAPTRVVAPVREPSSLDAVRNSVSGIDGDDLDVPAFIRKRMDT